MQMDEFAEMVSDALDHLYDQASLQTHPLAPALGIHPLPGETRAEALRRTLHEAVESLRPPASVPQSQPEWLPYRVLSLHYLGSWPAQDVCGELSFSMSSFYRQRNRALEAVASVLWSQRSPLSGQDREPGEPTQEQAGERTIRELTALPHATVSVPALLDGVIETLCPLAGRQRVTLRPHVAASSSTVCIAPQALRQILLGMLADCIATIEDGELPIQLCCRGQALVCQVQVKDACRCLAQKSNTAGEADTSFWRSLVEACEGRVWTRAGATGQSVLGVSIPLPSAAASVLIVEDDADAIALYRRHLEPAGYAVHAAHSEAEVREALARMMPDLILLDIILPERDGWTVLSELSDDARARRIPIVVCSIAAHAELARSLGAADVLQKPITREQLLETVAQCLNSRGTEASADPAGCAPDPSSPPHPSGRAPATR